jgi:hypothetical protein
MNVKTYSKIFPWYSMDIVGEKKLKYGVLQKMEHPLHELYI